MSEELKCPYCEGTASIAYHRTGNNLLYCHDCEKTFSEVGAQIMKQAARIAGMEAERDRLREAEIPVFVKQLEINGKLVKDINKFPPELQIRQIPWKRVEK